MTNKVFRITGYLVVLLSIVTSLSAAEYTWDKGAGTLDWNDPVNWSSNTKPGTNDTANFTATGIASGDTLLLGADQTVGTLKFGGAPTLTIGEGGYSLTLLYGNMLGGYTSNARTTTIASPLVLGTNGFFTGYGPDGNQTIFAGPISDGGNGFGVTLSSSVNDIFVMRGTNTYTGNTVIQGRPLTLTGPDGSLLHSSQILRPHAATAIPVGIILDNKIDANANRLNDTNDILMQNGRTTFSLYGHSATPVQEQAGLLDLRDGSTGSLLTEYNGTNVEAKFSGITRGDGASLVVDYKGTGVSGGGNAKITIAGAVTNAVGIWQPWACFGGYYINSWTPSSPSHVTVDADGTLKPFTNYVAFPTSGATGNSLYEMTTSSLTMTDAQEVYALLMRRNGTAVLDLASYDLHVAGGSLGFSTAGDKTIRSSGGGRLVFGSRDIVFFGSVGVLSISAPIASASGGPHNLLIPVVRAPTQLSFTGEDQIGTYGTLTADLQGKTLELGGPSDRTFTNGCFGAFNLKKSGPGTLRLTGTDWRNSGSTTLISEGRLSIGNSLGLAFLSYSDSSVIVTNAILEVESGSTWSGRFTIQANATLTGDGKFDAVKTIGNTMHVAPGHAVGKLTTASLTFGANSHIDWEVGTNTVTAGTDYDLLRVEGNFSLPPTPSVVTVHLYDASKGAAFVKNKSFTLVEWTGTDPANTPAWTFINHSEKTLDTSAATITVDNVNNKLVLTGLMDLDPNTTVIVIK